MEWFEGIKDVFANAADSVIAALPKSPIVYIASNSEAKKIMGYVNFFIPIYTYISLVEAWLTAIVVYYVVSVILRWLKVVE
ncbi:MAG: hypothetical protein J6C96_00540 [Oscillospiraceae bacterium]|nr:hypothetical protein [Oscillospiraceae bacterium]